MSLVMMPSTEDQNLRK